MVREFQSVIGKEAKRQIIDAENRLPDYLIACVGGGSNAMGLFHEFLRNNEIKMIGVEAGGKGIETGEHAARFAGGSLGVFQGCKSYLLQDNDGNVLETHSVSAGLDYASIGPEHPYLRDLKRVSYTYATDDEALNAFELLSKTEGIIPALESAHALAEVIKLAPRLSKEEIIIVNLSGRGDKDVQHVARIKGIEL
jgi:tryptophan synthase beta chain